MDLNYLYFRHQVALFRSEQAACEPSRRAHSVMAGAYAERIRAFRVGRRQATCGLTRHAQPGAEELRRHGIETVPSEIYLWDGYRYSNASDALAAAKRETRK